MQAYSSRQFMLNGEVNIECDFVLNGIEVCNATYPNNPKFVA